MAKRLLILGVFLAILAGAGFYFTGMHDPAEAAEDQTAQSAPQAASVAVLEIQPQKIVYTESLPGRITPYRQAQIRPQVDGIVTQRLFEEGADVKKGDQLYQIDDARYKALLNSALADLKSAQANIKSTEARAERYKDLVKIKAVSQQEYDDAVAALDQSRAGIAVAEAAVAIAQVNLDYTKVYAPIDGRIGKSLVTEGALVTANQTQNLAVITQLDPVFVDMQQSGSEAMQLRARMMGQDVIPVQILMSDDAKAEAYPHLATLKFSEVTIDETTGSIALRAQAKNPDALLLPGLFVRAILQLGEEEALLVPQRAATRTPDGGLSVWVVGEGNKAQMRQIKTSGAYNSHWIVTEGIEAGDNVIVEGYQKIGPDAPLNPTPWKQAESSKANSVEPPMEAPPEEVPANVPATTQDDTQPTQE